ncbi:MAG: sugar kinase [Candidatus Cloacimonetes bacterium]|nr:sugar kinase [Candidatus Cloacimonadota bacterium]MCF7813046.1 sugar kinase [Candidatus Cloacimonadota bacterium]MCF7867213.1 sugar kinase [Candidatus Cloacimonadota bacterium]MCF7882657.1 sugar kinase [Candidatus Cloacimonadota bacterium]
MDLVIVGSVALDAVKTPYGQVDRVLGGSAVYASMAARYFCRPGIVGVVGEDFPAEYLKLIKDQEIDTSGLQTRKGKTFFWKGNYNNMNCAETLDTQLNVFADFDPIIPQEYRKTKYIFLGNIDPVLQLEVLQQVENPDLTAMDTMNFWINGKRSELLEVIKKIDVLFINEDELRMLTVEKNILKAAKEALEYGPQLIVCKRGEYGAFVFGEDFLFYCPAYPIFDVIDPTGAGDSFAGGFLGYLAQAGKIDKESFKKAMQLGTITASFCVEDFSLNKLSKIELKKIEARAGSLQKYVSFK